MIKINKSANVPAVLLTEGVLETNKLTDAFAADPASFTSAPGIPAKNITKMEFFNTIYGHKTVKEQLITDQHDKCCFCEGKFSEHSFGDVEHFRPKKAYKNKGAGSLTYPGYYWLAYDWNNLIYSCEKCNRKYKRNDFPLTTEGTRKTHHLHPNDVQNEDCLLVNPIHENPELFITFKEEVPVPVANNLKGKTTIATFGLGRLNSARLEYLILLESILVFRNIDINNPVHVDLAVTTLNLTKNQVLEKVAQSNQFFDTAATDKGKFAHCVRCKFPHLPTK